MLRHHTGEREINYLQKINDKKILFQVKIEYI